MQMLAVRLLIVDDHEVVRRGLRALIGEQRDWQVVGEAQDGREAVAKAGELKPDIAIIDVTMPALNGLDAIRGIKKVSPQTKILVLTMHDSDSIIRKALIAGALGYICKVDASRDLVAAVNSLASGKTFFTRRVAQMVLDGYLGKGPKVGQEGQDDHSQITGREREIVQLLAEGRSSKEVANVLNLSVKTVETHRTNILRKLSCHSVSELVRYAVRNHIIEA
jgi:DNA-binding NarL/FixJ family response regulator